MTHTLQGARGKRLPVPCDSHCWIINWSKYNYKSSVISGRDARGLAESARPCHRLMAWHWGLALTTAISQLYLYLSYGYFTSTKPHLLHSCLVWLETGWMYRDYHSWMTIQKEIDAKVMTELNHLYTPLNRHVKPINDDKSSNVLDRKSYFFSTRYSGQWNKGLVRCHVGIPWASPWCSLYSWLWFLALLQYILLGLQIGDSTGFVSDFFTLYTAPIHKLFFPRDLH